MLYGDLQFFDIIIFAVIAAFIIYRLRAVLGKRTGFQKRSSDQSIVKKPHTPKQEEYKITQKKATAKKVLRLELIWMPFQ